MPRVTIDYGVSDKGDIAYVKQQRSYELAPNDVIIAALPNQHP